MIYQCHIARSAAIAILLLTQPAVAQMPVGHPTEPAAGSTISPSQSAQQRANEALLMRERQALGAEVAELFERQDRIDTMQATIGAQAKSVTELTQAKADQAKEITDLNAKLADAAKKATDQDAIIANLTNRIEDERKIVASLAKKLADEKKAAAEAQPK